MRFAWALALLLFALPAAAFEVRCPNGVLWVGSDPGGCPCCEVCPDGSWHIEGEEECIVYTDTRPQREPTGLATPTGQAVRSRVIRKGSTNLSPLVALFGPLFGGLLGIVVSLALGVWYFLPTLVAGYRRHRQTLAICLLNLLLGWTGLGWIAALVWSATAVERRE